MRYLKFLLAALLVTALAAGIALHLQRESIARGIANDVLAGSGLAVTELSISRLRADEIRFSRLVLEQDDGTRYEFHDLHVPLSLPDTTLRSATIGRLVLYPVAAGRDPPAYSELLDLAFALPDRFPGSTVTLGDIQRPGWPQISDLRWNTEHGAQELDLTVADVRVHVRAMAAAGAQRLAIEGSTAGTQEPGVRADVELRRAEPGYRMNGMLHFNLEPWVEYAAISRLMPVERMTAIVAGDADIEAAIADSRPGEVTVRATLRPADDSRLAWSAADDTLRVSAGMPQAIEIDAQLPARVWTLRTGPFDAVVSHALAERTEVSFESLACAPGECRLGVKVRAEAIAFEPLQAGSVDVAAEVALDLADGWLLDAVPTAVAVSGLQGEGWHVDSLESADPAGFRVSASTAGTAVNADRLTLDIGGLRMDNELSGSARVLLDGLEAALEPLVLKGSFELPRENLRLKWRDVPVAPADIEGRLDYADATGSAGIAATDPARGLQAHIDVRFSPDRIVATMKDATLSFDSAPLSATVGDWTQPWDLVGGTARVSGAIEWLGGNGETLAAEGRMELENGAATWNNLGASGIRASIPVRLEPGAAATIGPVAAHAALMDVGMALDDAAAEVTWDTATPNIEVRNLGFGLLGGRVTAAPFVFDVEKGSAALAFDVDAVQLGLIPELADFDAVELTGSLSGRIPVQVEDGTVTVDDGHLENEPPGGVIRYRAQDAPEGGSGLAMAQRALSNLQYETLVSDVAYSKDGDLVMKLRLKGVNPDLDPLQPVILNLTVENNIPQLLKSLQATRDIQDVIESRTLKNSANPAP